VHFQLLLAIIMWRQLSSKIGDIRNVLYETYTNMRQKKKKEF